MKSSKTTENESLQDENDKVLDLVSEILELIGNTQSFLDEAAATLVNAFNSKQGEAKSWLISK